MEDTVVLKFGMCNECGTYGIARYWRDGSFKVIVPGCPKHGKTNPCIPHQRVDEEFAKAKAPTGRK